MTGFTAPPDDLEDLLAKVSGEPFATRPRGAKAGRTRGAKGKTASRSRGRSRKTS
jgi:hypothetical protein